MKKLAYLLLLAFFMLACKQSQPQAPYSFYLGTYTNGDSEGIYYGQLDMDGRFDTLSLVAQTENPSFLAFDNKKNTLLAVGEVNVEGTGTVQSYQVLPNGLKHVSTSLSGGAHPCHLSVNNKGDVLMANYSGGNIGYVTLDEERKLSDLRHVAQHSGKSIMKRQNAPHAHSVYFLDEVNVVAVDLGIDQLIFYRMGDKQLIKTDSLLITAGAGPRHLAIHPQKKVLYVINELNSTVSVVEERDGHWHLSSAISTLPADFAGESYCADIHISADGRFLYASNRGHNSLAIYQLNEDGKELSLVAHESVKGDWPRNFALTPDNEFLVVANERSNNIIAFKRNQETGLLTFVSEVKAASPVCVLFD
ncbi:lactonase family protein [Carboxylicivirga marina]|uniref:lactonase family protein n=1 Tax=Carboxylicivirga marina TaxID=2800988 RepID=UPI0025982314|nr:lactonase family protein [uncultured Carboxylicivirga sp.]